ncbi:MAG: hypothetical protein DME33_03955 [Verrucomicrobia bacterium]|nr:MAG: hypothetical protein DME33_03955 [Verrucomicrobiota bacterium]
MNLGSARILSAVYAELSRQGRALAVPANAERTAKFARVSRLLQCQMFTSDPFSSQMYALSLHKNWFKL